MYDIRTAARQFTRDDEGIAVMEYGLLVAVVAMVLVGALKMFSGHITTWFSQRTETITAA